eukprot:3575180-Amphidinium_carterae.1
MDQKHAGRIANAVQNARDCTTKAIMVTTTEVGLNNFCVIAPTGMVKMDSCTCAKHRTECDQGNQRFCWACHLLRLAFSCAVLVGFHAALLSKFNTEQPRPYMDEDAVGYTSRLVLMALAEVSAKPQGCSCLVSSNRFPVDVWGRCDMHEVQVTVLSLSHSHYSRCHCKVNTPFREENWTT